jgi:membrane protease YdiL (CAAX protease family)
VKGLRTAALVATSGCVLLVMRPTLLEATRHDTAVLIAVFCCLGLIGLAWPQARQPQARQPHAPQRADGSRSLAVTVLVVGLAAFAVGRVLGGGRTPAPPTLHFIALNTLAAVAEEAFFRRFVYGLLLPSGALWAIGGSATLFAIVHITTYGYWVVPIDIAAGLLLGWQRWSSGGWAVPAVTHVAANVLVVI